MFENIMVEFLNKFFGNYFENIDASHLNLSVWKGDVVLSNVYVKSTAMDNLYLPFQVVAGRVGTITMKFPWKNLYGAPVELTLRDLHLVARPSQTVPYNQDEEEKQNLMSKMKKVEEMEDARRIAQQRDQPGTSVTTEAAPIATPNSNFKEKLLMHIIKNVQIRIEGIHIRYEDMISNPNIPFSFGLVLSSLNLQTTDGNWYPVYIIDGVHPVTFYKLMTLNGLAFYLNADGKLIGERNSTRDKILQALDSLIKEGKGLNYMIGPITSEIKVSLTPSPETTQPAFSLPKILIQIGMNQLALGISNTQFQDMFRLAETIEFMARARKWRKYRPDVRSYKGNSKAWWKFAYACILVEIRRRRQSWDYSNIKKHIQLCKLYSDSYYKKIVQRKNRPEIEDQIRSCEKQLDLFNILLIRTQVEFKKERLDKLEIEQRRRRWGPQFLGWNASEFAEEIAAKLEEAWTPAERSKLNHAMGYTDNAKPVSYPKQYSQHQLDFNLKQLNMVITEFDANSSTIGKQLVRLKVENLESRAQHRPVKHGLSVECKVGSLRADTIPSADGLVTQVMKGQNVAGEPLLQFKYEKFPLDFPTVDKRIRLVAKSLEVIYHTKTVQQLVQCFSIPSEIQLRTLRTNAATRISEWKETSSARFRHMVQKKTDGELLLDIVVAAPYFIIPANEQLDENSNVLIVDLGQLCVKNGPPEPDVDDELSVVTVPPTSAVYTVELKNFQVLIALPGMDLRLPVSTEPQFIIPGPIAQARLNNAVILPTVTFGNGLIETLRLNAQSYNPANRSQTLAEVVNPTKFTLILVKSATEGSSVELRVSDIFIRLSAGTVELFERISKSWTASTWAAELQSRQGMDRIGMWEPKINRASAFWFLKNDEPSVSNSLQAFPITVIPHSQTGRIKHSPQVMSLRPTSVIVTFEVGAETSTIPLLFFETKIELEVSDWSEQVRAIGKLNLAAAYSNTNLGMWEYLIEPVEAGHYGSATHRPWELVCEISKSWASLKDSSQMSLLPTTNSAIGGDAEQEFHRVYVVTIFSDDILEITVTKTAIEVLNKLETSFKGVKKATVSNREVSKSPYVFVNDTGADLKLLLQNGPFLYIEQNKAPHSGEVSVLSGTEINLALDITRAHYSVLREQEGRIERHLDISISEYRFNMLVQVNRAEGKFYPLQTPKGRTSSFQNGLVCDVRVKDCSVLVTISGLLKIVNHLTIPIDVFCVELKSKQNKKVGSVDAGSRWNVPISVLNNYLDGLSFASAGFNQSTISFSWLSVLTKSYVKAILVCASAQSTLPCHMMVIGKAQEIIFENTNRQNLTGRTCTIHIRPLLVISNFLPTELQFYAKNHKDESQIAERGRSMQITCLEGKEDTHFDMMLCIPNYEGSAWTSNVIMKKSTEELSSWEFSSNTKKSIHLGIRKEVLEGRVILQVYFQFWMINLTGMALEYKLGEDKTRSVIVSHPPNQVDPVMLSMGGKDFLTTKTARLKCKDSEWSEVFYLDVAGSSGSVKCITKASQREYQFDLTTSLVNGSFTKIVTFKPRFYIVNQCPFGVTLNEADVQNESIAMNAKQCSPFWPKGKSAQLVAKISSTEDASAAFNYTGTHSTLLSLKNRFGGLYVQVLVASNRIVITIEEYKEGQAPALLLNATKDLSIEYGELSGSSTPKEVLLPGTNRLFTWNFPMSKRTIVWSPLSASKTEIMDLLLTDGSGSFSVLADSAEGTYYWVSFLDRYQRILLFTDNPRLAKSFEESKTDEETQVEVSFSLNGVGLSLVDNVKCREVLYMRISSIGVVWETTRDPKSNRYKLLEDQISVFLETKYAEYAHDSADDPFVASVYTFGNDFEVNLAEMMVTKPYQRYLRRCPLQPGFWIYFKKFAHSTQFHFKVSHVQVDNQLPNSTYPVLLSQVVPPKSVKTESETPKPFINMSLMRCATPQSESVQSIYSTVLIQEFHVKADLGLANAVSGVLDHSTRHREQVEQMFEEFQKSYELASIGCEKHFSRQLQPHGKKLHIENLQLSPIKLHLSFSVTSPEDGHNEPLLFLKSIGASVGSAQDVVFRLACLELKHMSLTTYQLAQIVKRHYSSQAMQQLYCWIFGLDVIGNPMGYLSGVTEGIETFFYEPVQGLILGPEEFAEGLSLGLKSLVGHTVGGAADALSKITGVLGKGFAMLTMDAEYQRRRHSATKKNLGEIAKIFLKTSLMDTVLGVVTSPIQGAATGGVAGFGLGLLKGTLGLVARPIGGAIDLASGTFDVLKRATRPTEVLVQTRPPRHMETNCGMVPYIRQTAEGDLIFKELKSRRELAGEHYVAHILVGSTTRQVFLITETRAFFLTLNDIYGRSSIEWEHPFEAFTGPPIIQEVERGLCFTLRERRKSILAAGTLLNRNQGEKLVVPISDAEMCVWMLTKITDAMTEHSRTLQV